MTREVNEPAVRSGARGPAGPLLWCTVAAALFGASTPATKALLPAVGPLLLSGGLYLGAALAVLPWVLVRRSAARPRADRRNVVYLSLAVLFGGVVGPVLLLSGLSLATAASVSLWLNLETVATAVLARAFFREHLGPRTWIAVALVIAASLLLSPGTPGGSAAMMLVALACVAWGLDNNFTALIDHFSPTEVTLANPHRPDLHHRHEH